MRTRACLCHQLNSIARLNPLSSHMGARLLPPSAPAPLALCLSIAATPAFSRGGRAINSRLATRPFECDQQGRPVLLLCPGVHAILAVQRRLSCRSISLTSTTRRHHHRRRRRPTFGGVLDATRAFKDSPPLHPWLQYFCLNTGPHPIRNITTTFHFIIVQRPQVGGPSVPPKLGLHRIILQLQDSSLLPRSSLAAPTGIFITQNRGSIICWASVPQRRQEQAVLQVSDAASRLLATSQS
jgi:hypothetical protein